MLYIRGLIFAILVPFVVGVVVPSLLHRDIHASVGLKIAGGVVILIGVALYGMCLLRFLLSGGTPAIFSHILRLLTLLFVGSAACNATLVLTACSRDGIVIAADGLSLKPGGNPPSVNSCKTEHG